MSAEHAHQFSFDDSPDLKRTVSEMHHWMDIRSTFEAQILKADEEISLRKSYILDAYSIRQSKIEEKEVNRMISEGSPVEPPPTKDYGRTETALDLAAPKPLHEKIAAWIQEHVFQKP